MHTFGSLFAGIGGFDLGFERAGWRCAWQVEIDPACRAVLERHWPGVRRHDDVHTWPDDAAAAAPELDAIIGGFPCQPVSCAGKRLGVADPRWLWPQFAKVVARLRPRAVVVENPPGLRTRGLRDVLAFLSDLGFDAEWEVLSAQALGAPHLRRRLVIVATDPRRVRLEGEREPQGESWLQGALRHELERCAAARARAAPDPVREGLPDGQAAEVRGREGAERGRGGWWSVEPPVARMVHGVPGRVDRIRALGNAIVPQVAEVVARALTERLQGAPQGREAQPADQGADQGNRPDGDAAADAGAVEVGV